MESRRRGRCSTWNTVPRNKTVVGTLRSSSRPRWSFGKSDLGSVDHAGHASCSLSRNTIALADPASGPKGRWPSTALVVVVEELTGLQKAIESTNAGSPIDAPTRKVTLTGGGHISPDCPRALDSDHGDYPQRLCNRVLFMSWQKGPRWSHEVHRAGRIDLPAGQQLGHFSHQGRGSIATAA